MTDAEAVVLMVDSNLQRENLLPSEKAFAYKMKLDALKHQGKSTLDLDQVGPRWSVKEISKTADDSMTRVKRYIRLTNLVKPLLNMVDESCISFSPAVELSYLTGAEQAELWDQIKQQDATPSLSQAIRMKQLSRVAKLTPEVIFAILTETKPNQKEQVRLKTERLQRYFPKSYTPQQMEQAIMKMLGEHYHKKQREQER